MSGRRGFTLLEVLVATVIMGIAVAGLIAGLSQSVRNAARLTEYDRAAVFARTKMNDLLLDSTLPFASTFQGEIHDGLPSGVTAGWRASTRPFDQPRATGPGTMVLQEIALEVWWQPTNGTRRILQLAGYRQARVPVAAGL